MRSSAVSSGPDSNVLSGSQTVFPKDGSEGGVSGVGRKSWTQHELSSS